MHHHVSGMPDRANHLRQTIEVVEPLVVYRKRGQICSTVPVTIQLISPIYRVLATIGEAAKIFKDKNTN